MANKRSLKHVINLICEELFAEAVAASLYGNEQVKDNADALLFSIIRLQSNYINRISHVEPGMKAKQYFKLSLIHICAEAGEIIDQINNL